MNSMKYCLKKEYITPASFRHVLMDSSVILVAESKYFHFYSRKPQTRL